MAIARRFVLRTHRALKIVQWQQIYESYIYGGQKIAFCIHSCRSITSRTEVAKWPDVLSVCRPRVLRTKCLLYIAVRITSDGSTFRNICLIVVWKPQITQTRTHTHVHAVLGAAVGRQFVPSFAKRRR